MSKLTSSLRTLILIISISFIWNIFIPGVVAYIDGVFYVEDVEAKFPQHSEEAAQSYQSYKKKRATYEQSISTLDLQVSNVLQKGGDYSELDSLIKVREIYREELSNLHSPVAINGFYGYSSIYYFLASYIFLGVGIFVLRPEPSEKLSRSQIIIFALLMYLSWGATAHIRNFILFDRGRKVISYINYDVSPASYILQDLRLLIMSILVSILCRQWIVHYDEVRRRISSWEDAPQGLVELTEHSQVVSDTFHRWQLNSLVIVGAFLPWTIFYWVYVFQYRDNRYILAALVIHLYWAISWMIISAPLIHVFSKWSILKAKTLAAASSRQDDSKETDRAISFIKEVNPLSNFQIVGAGIVTVISFLLPLINLFIGR